MPRRGRGSKRPQRVAISTRVISTRAHLVIIVTLIIVTPRIHCLSGSGSLRGLLARAGVQAAAEGSSKDQLEISRRIRMCCLRQSIKAAFPVDAGGGLRTGLGLVVVAAGGGRAAIR